MAEQEDIDAAKRLLGPDAAESGWTDEYIGTQLDDGVTADQIAYRWWSQRAAETANYVNISESGSSRNLATIHQQALNLAKLYGDKAESSDSGGDSGGQVSGLRSYPMRRV